MEKHEKVYGLSLLIIVGVIAIVGVINQLHLPPEKSEMVEMVKEKDYESIQNVVKDIQKSVTGSSNPSLYEQLLFELAFAGEPYSKTVKDIFNPNKDYTLWEINFSVSLVHEMIRRQKVPDGLTEYVEIAINHLNTTPIHSRVQLLEVSRFMDETNPQIIEFARINLDKTLNNEEFDLTSVMNLFEYSGYSLPQNLRHDIEEKLSRLDSMSNSLDVLIEKYGPYQEEIDHLSKEIVRIQDRYNETIKRKENKLMGNFFIVREYYSDNINAVAYEAKRFGEPCLVTTKTFTYQSKGNTSLEVYYNGTIKMTYDGFHRDIPVFVEYTDDDRERYNEYLDRVVPNQVKLRRIQEESSDLNTIKSNLETKISLMSDSIKTGLKRFYSLIN